MSKEELLPIGRIIGAHGVKGELKVIPFGTFEGIRWTEVYLSALGQRAFKVLKVRPHQNALLLTIERIASRNDAELLAGMEISVRKQDLPELEDDEFYHHELLGMEVWTEDERLLGRIENIISTGGNDVFEVHGPFGEVLIPAIEDTVLKIDTDGGRITVSLMEGLLPEVKEAGEGGKGGKGAAKKGAKGSKGGKTGKNEV